MKKSDYIFIIVTTIAACLFIWQLWNLCREQESVGTETPSAETTDDSEWSMGDFVIVPGPWHLPEPCEGE